MEQVWGWNGADSNFRWSYRLSDLVIAGRLAVGTRLPSCRSRPASCRLSPALRLHQMTGGPQCTDMVFLITFVFRLRHKPHIHCPEPWLPGFFYPVGLPLPPGSAHPAHDSCAGMERHAAKLLSWRLHGVFHRVGEPLRRREIRGKFV